jgi:hydrogenase nickel insertion protein HypA
MHEVSIAQSLLKIAVDNCKKEGYKGIEIIKVKIGRASGIMPDALSFAFDAVKIGTIAEKAALNIEEIPVSGFCELQKITRKHTPIRPLCGGVLNCEIIGHELYSTKWTYCNAHQCAINIGVVYQCLEV